MLGMSTWSFPELGHFGNTMLPRTVVYDNFVLCQSPCGGHVDVGAERSSN